MARKFPLGQEELKKILEVNDSLAKQALRVLGCAYRVMPSLPEKMDASSIEKDLIFTGLVAMIDPPRSEAIEAMGKCLQAGIKPVMITGDHKLRL